MRPATAPPATSTCAMIQPPKMSPFWFASAGIGMTRNAGCLCSGSFSMSHVVERPAAERREAGAEDEARVDKICLRHDAFVEYALRLGEIRPDQLLDELRTRGIGRALLRLAVHPGVDALPSPPLPSAPTSACTPARRWRRTPPPSPQCCAAESRPAGAA